MYSEDYLEGLIKATKSYSKPIEDLEPKVKSKRRINIHEYKYSDGTTSIIIEGREEIIGLCERDIINLVRKTLRNKDAS